MSGDDHGRAGEAWRDGRLIDPARPGICVHLVSTSPGFWCSECIAALDPE